MERKIKVRLKITIDGYPPVGDYNAEKIGNGDYIIYTENGNWFIPEAWIKVYDDEI